MKKIFFSFVMLSLLVSVCYALPDIEVYGKNSSGLVVPLLVDDSGALITAFTGSQEFDKTGLATEGTLKNILVYSDSVYVALTELNTIIQDLSDTVVYYNTAFDSAYYTDTYATASNWSVSSDTLLLVDVYYKSDTGVFKNVWVRNDGSPISVVEHDGNYIFICLLTDISADSIKAIFKRK